MQGALPAIFQPSKGPVSLASILCKFCKPFPAGIRIPVKLIIDSSRPKHLALSTLSDLDRSQGNNGRPSALELDSGNRVHTIHSILVLKGIS